MKKLSYQEFDAVAAKQWKQNIQSGLNGADYNSALLTQTNEGVNINPFYHQDQTQYLEVEMPKTPTKICQAIFVDAIEKTKSLVNKALKGGATALVFEADKAFNVDELFSNNNIPTNISLYFKLHFLSETFSSSLIKNTAAHAVFLNADIIGNLANSGNWFSTKEHDFKYLAKHLKNAPKNVSILSVDAGLYQNAGANCVQQVAYALAHLNEYFNAFADGILPLPVNNKIQINLAVGGNYFFEIAKLRAFRYLFDLINKEYQFNFTPELVVSPSMRNKSIYDYNVNMLRTTTECMSAILGGANAVSNLAYDHIYHKSNEFGERIARNQLLILKEESYFKASQNVVEGTYYVETLTVQIAEKALQLFKEIEQKGGFVNQLFSGIIQRKIKENAQKEQVQFNEGSMQFIGVNKHPNPQDLMKDNLQLYPFLKIKARKTLVQPIIANRLAETLEQERLAKERSC